MQAIAAGFGVSFITDSEGNLYCFGSCKLSTHAANVAVPTLVTKIPGPVQQVDLGMNYAMCVTSDGKLFAWGNNTWQQSGTGQVKADIKTPAEVPFFT